MAHGLGNANISNRHDKRSDRFHFIEIMSCREDASMAEGSLAGTEYVALDEGAFKEKGKCPVRARQGKTLEKPRNPDPEGIQGILKGPWVPNRIKFCIHITNRNIRPVYTKNNQKVLIVFLIK